MENVNTSPLMCRTNGIGHYEPAVALIGGEPRCGDCAEVIEKRGPVDRQPLPGQAAAL